MGGVQVVWWPLVMICNGTLRYHRRRFGVDSGALGLVHTGWRRVFFLCAPAGMHR